MSRAEPIPHEKERPLRVAQWARIRWWNACAYYAVTLAESLALRGHASFVLAPRGTPVEAEAHSRGLPTPDVGDLGSTHPGEWLRSGRRLERFLREEGIELINVHSGPGHARLVWLCRRMGIPLVRTRGDIRLPRTSFIHRWLYARGTTHHVVSADFLARQAYPPLGIAPARITTLRGGINLEKLDRVSKSEARREVWSRLELDSNALLVGMVARLSPVKGHADFLNAMALLAPYWPDLQLVVVGPDAQITREELREVARAQGLEARTHLVGRVDDPLVWAAALDVAVIASYDSEAICRSAFEYLGLGVPLVATEINAVAEVVVPGTGLLVPPSQPAAIASAVEALLASKEIRFSLGEAGRDHVRERYGLEQLGEEAEMLFRRLVRESRRATQGVS